MLLVVVIVVVGIFGVVLFAEIFVVVEILAVEDLEQFKPDRIRALETLDGVEGSQVREIEVRGV